MSVPSLHIESTDSMIYIYISEFATRTDQASTATHIRHSSEPLIEVSDQFAPETILQASVVMNVAG